jgi:hypothetical protein
VTEVWVLEMDYFDLNDGRTHSEHIAAYVDRELARQHRKMLIDAMNDFVHGGRPSGGRARRAWVREHKSRVLALYPGFASPIKDFGRVPLNRALTVFEVPFFLHVDQFLEKHGK